MKEKFIICLFIISILSACKSKNATMPTSTLNVLPIVQVYTPTTSPTETSQRLLATPTLSPTQVPTNTPTFNITVNITRTSMPPEKCPTLSKAILPNLTIDSNNFNYSFSSMQQKVLDYLNAGGSPSDLITEIRQTWKTREVFSRNEVIRDLTGNDIPEILIIPSEAYILGCHNGKYEILLNLGNDAAGINYIGNQLVGVEDINRDGTPEIVIANFSCGGFGYGQCLTVYIFEWNGKEFVSLFPEQGGYFGNASMNGRRLNVGLPNVSLQDVDNNGTKELILTGGIPSTAYQDYFDHYPWRDQSDIYTWNGQNFVFYKTEFSSPVYRYQAVQDGDRTMLNHEYDKALAFYQDAIFSNTLLGWSPTQKERYKSLFQYTWDSNFQLTPTPSIPPDDPQEYPNLAAYARYRIMLLHIIQGHLKEAQVVYETLQEKFPEGSNGHEYSVIAKAFWGEYQLSKDIGKACADAISMTNEHQEVLRFLGSDYHNSRQDLMYKPTDICPFK